MKKDLVFIKIDGLLIMCLWREGMLFFNIVIIDILIWIK